MPTLSHGSPPLDVQLADLGIPRAGRVYDLSSGWWPGMPMPAAHPAFQVLAYRTPRGVRNQGDVPLVAQGNSVNFGFVSELVMCTTHSGTHIDALCHVTSGPDDSWHGGDSADAALGDFGALSNSAASLPPLIRRGVMLDIAGALGVDRLPAHHAVGAGDLARACESSAVALRDGDVVLVRVGGMRGWPDADALAASDGAGIDLGGAQWLAASNPSAIGADTAALEVLPSTVAGDPHPVHRFLLRERGIPILEWVNLEELARDAVYEFLFICLPVPIRGATGSIVRPVAIA